MSITENVRMARQKINAAAESAGRSGSEVRLLAATKMNGPEAVQEAIRAGVDICAENRVQEFLSKNAVNAYAPCCVHFIGHLQKNKVKYLVGAVELIHSVDSPELMDAISRRAVSLGIVQDVLLEVNIGGVQKRRFARRARGAPRPCRALPRPSRERIDDDPARRERRRRKSLVFPTNV